MKPTLIALALLCLPSLAAAEPQKHDSVFKLTSASLIGLAAIDGSQTTTCVRAGRCREANPLYKPIAGNYVGMAAFKTAMAAGVITVAWKLRQQHGASAVIGWTLLGATTAAQAFAVGWNAHALKR
jgi:hypothetical protein